MGKIGVPHVSLVGPLESSHRRKMISEILIVSVKITDPPELRFKGFGKFQHGWLYKKEKVAFAKIVPFRNAPIFSTTLFLLQPSSFETWSTIKPT